MGAGCGSTARLLNRRPRFERIALLAATPLHRGTRLSGGAEGAVRLHNGPASPKREWRRAFVEHVHADRKRRVSFSVMARTGHNERRRLRTLCQPACKRSEATPVHHELWRSGQPLSMLHAGVWITSIARRACTLRRQCGSWGDRFGAQRQRFRAGRRAVKDTIGDACQRLLSPRRACPT
jgi:hypothetical protein